MRGFIADQLDLLATISNAITIASTLRAYLRYRATCGDAVQPLLAVIATPAHWSLAPLPRALKPEEVDRLLSSFTDALPSPRRGYAVVRLHSTWVCAASRSIDCNWPTSTGAWALSRSSAPSRAGRTSFRCPWPPAVRWRPSSDTNARSRATGQCSCATSRRMTNP